MLQRLAIEYVSDIACPWCVIGLRNLEAALRDLDGEIAAEIRFAPFELNPNMPPEGMDRATYFAEKYRLPEAETKARGEAIREEAAKTGFAMNAGSGFRLRNTFDAHRLLEWALEERGAGAQRTLKHALFAAYFSDGRNIADRGELAAIAGEAGLDPGRAEAMLSGEDHAEKVREIEAAHRVRGIFAVPAILIEGRYQINGSHPPDRFAKALRHIAGELVEAA